MTLDLDLQIALDMPGLPAEADLRRWAEAALVGADYQKDAELTIRIVNEAEITALNESYRHKQGPTNVLSFPFEPPPEIATPLLGDIVICAPVVLHEAINQGKAVAAHWRIWSHMAFCTCWAMIMTKSRPRQWNPLKSAFWRDWAIPIPMENYKTHERRTIRIKP
jgi:probable rRNA maturation factor